MLSTQSITYSDDYQQPPELSLRKVPVLPIAVPPPPEREPQLQPSASASITLVFKSLKPNTTFTISVRPTDTISAIKTQLAAEPSAPPADVQRLLFKGKALADGKLLKEYNNIKDGDTINLMVKPGFDWNTIAITTVPTSPVSASPMPTSSLEPLSIPSSSSFKSGTLHPEARSKQGGRKHQRIPSVMLSPSSSLESSGAGEKDILLTIDPGVLPSPVLQSDNMSTYHQTMSRPEFWERLYDFMKNEFQNPVDVHSAFEDFLCAAKGSLTASEIAKIRDQVGVVGMAGT
jgi:UV excision repair protein RAD23